MANAELIRKVIKHIEEHNRWDQRVWGAVHQDQIDDNDEVLPETWEGLTESETRFGDTYYAVDARLVLEGACNTRFCMAGHTVLQAGDKIMLNAQDGHAEYCKDKDGNTHNIQARARELLGLDSRASDILFDGVAGNKDLEEYKRLVTRVTGVTFEEEQANA